MRYILFAALFAASASPAEACLYPPPPVECIEQTDEASRLECTNAALQTHLKESARKWEERNYEQAESIYFARIVRSEEINVEGSPYARKVTVEPLQVFRGQLPKGLITLRDRELTSCGLNGDGKATWGAVSDIAIVFEGVEPSGFENKSTVDSVLARNAAHPALVDAWQEWKKSANFLYDFGAQEQP